jgi:hypothetical protein
MLREEHRFMVFERRMLWRIFGIKRDEVIEGCKKLRNKELFITYYYNNKIRENEMDRICRVHGEKAKIRTRFCSETSKEETTQNT